MGPEYIKIDSIRPDVSRIDTKLYEHSPAQIFSVGREDRLSYNLYLRYKRLYQVFFLRIAIIYCPTFYKIQGQILNNNFSIISLYYIYIYI